MGLGGGGVAWGCTHLPHPHLADWWACWVGEGAGGDVLTCHTPRRLTDGAGGGGLAGECTYLPHPEVAVWWGFLDGEGR